MKLTPVFVWSTICTAPLASRRSWSNSQRVRKNVSVAMRPGIAQKRISPWHWKRTGFRSNISWARAHSTVRKLNLPCMTVSIRAWQCGTVQLDFSLPQRLSASYVGEDNERQVPVMIHRAILGSLERFIGILTEEFAGFFPTWLAPVQVVVMNITDSQADYVKELTQKLQNAGIRVKADLRNEKIGFKIREHTLRRVPYMLVCGDKEVEAGKVAVRTRRGKDLGSLDVSEVIEKLQQEIRSRSLQQLEE